VNSLLDAHALLWFLNDDPKLEPNANYWSLNRCSKRCPSSVRMSFSTSMACPDCGIELPPMAVVTDEEGNMAAITLFINLTAGWNSSN